MEHEPLDGMLAVKVPRRWLDLIDSLGDPGERDRGKVLRRLLRKALESEGLLPSSSSAEEKTPTAQVGRQLSGHRKRFRPK